MWELAEDVQLDLTSLMFKDDVCGKFLPLFDLSLLLDARWFPGRHGRGSAHYQELPSCSEGDGGLSDKCANGHLKYKP